MSARLARLSRFQFATLAAQLAAPDAACALARQVLVDGLQAVTVAELAGVPRRRVLAAVHAFEAAYLAGAPPRLGWVMAQMVIPEQVAHDVRATFDALLLAGDDALAADAARLLGAVLAPLLARVQGRPVAPVAGGGDAGRGPA